jgi:superfamily II DNA/RNA helicase
MRISNSIARTQRVIFSEVLSDRIDILAEKMMEEPFLFEIEEDEEEDEDDVEDEDGEADEDSEGENDEDEK